jgi:phosphatidylglycerophosphatase A
MARLMARFHKIPAGLTGKLPAIWVATFFGSGLLRPASGTWGSLAALPVGYALHAMAGFGGLVVGAGIAYALGMWASDIWLQHDDNQDPSAIVIDEVAGLWLALAFVPATLAGWAAAFLLFRFFDIVKPWPVSWADTKLKGAEGVMADDILAGCMSALALYLLQRYGLSLGG